MIGVGTTHEWVRFLEVRSAEDAVSELRRMVAHLDAASDEAGSVLTQLSGSPDEDVEEALRVGRASVNEAIGLINGAVMRIRLGDPDAA